MTLNEKLEGVAKVLLMAAAKLRELSDTGAKDGPVSRKTALALQIAGIAYELRALSMEVGDGKGA